MILYLNYQYLVIRKGQAFHTFLVPFSVYSYQKQLSKNTEKTTARADQTTCISVVIKTFLKLKKYFFSRIFCRTERNEPLRHGPFTHDQHNSIFKFLGGVTEINYQEVHIFWPKKVMTNRLYCLDRKYCSHFCIQAGTGSSLSWWQHPDENISFSNIKNPQ